MGAIIFKPISISITIFTTATIKFYDKPPLSNEGFKHAIFGESNDKDDSHVKANIQTLKKKVLATADVVEKEPLFAKDDDVEHVVRVRKVDAKQI